MNSRILTSEKPHWKLTESKVCEVCGEKYHPADSTRLSRWRAQRFCGSVCSGKSAGADASRKYPKTFIRHV
jgi:hypothetical protein